MADILPQAAPAGDAQPGLMPREPGILHQIGHAIGPFLSVKGIISLAMILLIIVPAIFAPLVAPYNPLTPDILHRFANPSLAHLFGTDAIGRDLFTRCLYGARLSLTAAATIILLSLLIGVPVGVFAGYQGGLADTLLMRITDIFLAFPSLILAMAVAAALGTSLTNAVIALAVVNWPTYGRIARGQVLSVKQNLYVEGARAVGVGTFRILGTYVMPNSVQPIVVLAALDFSGAIISVAGLSFIGLGAQPPTAELGIIIQQGQAQLLNFPWIAVLPGLVMFAIAIGMNLLGDVIQDILDPRRLRSRG